MDERAVVAVALFGMLAVVAGGFATQLVFRFVDGRREHERGAAPASNDKTSQHASQESPGGVEQAGSILRGGAWIGALERLAIFAGLVANWPEAIAIVLAVKGLGRYPELRSGENSAVAERFIIGTFVSVLWACGCAGLAVWSRG